MPDVRGETPRLDARTFGWAAACAAATLPLIVLIVFRGDLRADIYSDPAGDEVLWIIWHLQATFEQIWQAEGLLPALRYALVDGYPYFGNVLQFWCISIPLRALLPYPLWFNVNALVVDALNAFGAAVLVIALTRSRAAGMLAAMAVALNPYTLLVLQRGRHRDALFVFVALFLAALLRAAATDRVRDHVTCALWLAVTGLFYWFYALFGALCAGVWALTRALSPRGLAITVGLAVLLCLPFAAPFYGQGRSSWRHYPWLTSLPSHAQIEQMPRGALWNGIDDQMVRLLLIDCMSAEWIVGSPSARGAQPVALLLLALAGAAVGGRRARPWIATAVVFYVIGLGPNLRLQETTCDVELPYRLMFRVVPFLSRLYHPRYASLFTLCSLLALAALAVSAAPSRRLRLAICGLGALSLVGTACLAPGLPSVHVEIPHFYATLSRRPPGGLVELPCYRNNGRQAGRSFYQTLHDRPVIGCLGGYGWEIRWPASLQPTRALLDEDTTRIPDERELDAMIASWRAAGARWVVLHQAGGMSDAAVYDRFSAALTAHLGRRVHQERVRRPFTERDTRRGLLRVWEIVPADEGDVTLRPRKML